MQTLNRKLKKKEKQLYWQALAFILEYCQKPNPARLSYLHTQALEFGLSEEDIEKIKKITQPLDLIKSLNKIEDISLKRLILREMIMLAVSAHELHEEEVTIIYQIGNAIGINTDRIDDFFMWAAKGIEWQIDGARMVEED